MKDQKFIWTEHELLAEYRRWLVQELGHDLSGTKTDLRGMDDGRLQLSIPESWKNEGLFGKVKKGDPPLFKQVGRGQPEGGSDILYFALLSTGSTTSL